MKLFARCDPGSAVVVVEGAGLGMAPTGSDRVAGSGGADVIGGGPGA